MQASLFGSVRILIQMLLHVPKQDHQFADL